MAYVDIDYVDGDASKYRSVKVGVDMEAFGTVISKTEVFDTGDPMVDMYNANRFIANGPMSEICVYSSSFDNFFVDGDKYTIARLVMEGEVPRLDYESHNGFMFIVPKGGSLLWDELKSVCELRTHNHKIVKELIDHYKDISFNYCNRTAVCSQLGHMGYRLEPQPGGRKQLDNAYDKIHNAVKAHHELKNKKDGIHTDRQ